MTVLTRVVQLKTALEAMAVPQRFTVLAVSKGVLLTSMREAYAAGITSFGESYWQEAIVKKNALTDLPIDWHFIGRLQSNKCALIAKEFNWVQSVCHWHHATRLHQARTRLNLGPLNICLQVNMAREPQKDGLPAAEVAAFVARLPTLPTLRLRGLMLVAPQDAAPLYREFVALFQRLQQQFNLSDTFDTLSMGMSGDYHAALMNGSTMIRIGSLLFKD